jgi:hypothetical protein
MKSHISPEGPGRCTARPGNCPFGGDENHFSTIAEARSAYQERLESAYRTLTTVTKSGYRLTPAEQALRQKNFELSQALVEARAARGDVVFEDADPARAQRRLQEAVAFAEGRSNTVLSSKLATARVLPSGAFRTAGGVRVNTDALLKTHTALRTVEEARERALATLASRIGTAPAGEKYSLKVEGVGSFTLTVSEGLSEEEFHRMPEKLQQAVSSEREVLDAKLAATKLSPEKFAQITASSQVIDYVVGKEPATDAPATIPLRESSRMEDGLADIATYYRRVHSTAGKVRTMRAELAAGSEAVKATAASQEGNVFAPARSQANGALVAWRSTVVPEEAWKVLTPEELKSITTVKREPDAAKAAAMLTRTAFDKIFKAKKVSLRVYEAKD